MPDERAKPAIPAWQRKQDIPAAVPEKEDGKSEEESTPVAPEWEEAAWQQNTPAEAALSPQNSTQDDEKSAPPEEALKTSDFESYRREQNRQKEQATTPTVGREQPAAPPIITYPEYLVEAHKPPPLITLSRIWNTAQIVSGAAALIYGASKYLVTPMSDSLTEARHDFASHSQSKIDEFTERLSKLVSKVPLEKKERSPEADGDDSTSETSDPTELYHRDMGTQTSPASSRENSMSGSIKAASGEKKKTSTDYQTSGLNILNEHLSEMLERANNLETPYKDRQDKLDNLKNYLDVLMYTSPAISAWSVSEDLGKSSEGGKEDAVDDLKKEIRAVKGLMLSAKRFPGVAGRVAGT